VTRWLLVVIEGGAERLEHVFKYFIVPIGYVGGYSMCFEAPGRYGGGVLMFWCCRT